MERLSTHWRDEHPRQSEAYHTPPPLNVKMDASSSNGSFVRYRPRRIRARRLQAPAPARPESGPDGADFWTPAG